MMYLKYLINILFCILPCIIYSQNNIKGDNLLLSSTNGTVGNIKFGQYSGINMYGIENVYVGNSGNLNSPSSRNNVSIGFNAFKYPTASSRNTIIGSYAGRNIRNASGTVWIGYSAGSDISFSNTSNIGGIDNSDTICPLINFDFSNNLVRICGDLEVNGIIESSTSIDSIWGIDSILNHVYLYDPTDSVTFPYAKIDEIISYTDSELYQQSCTFDTTGSLLNVKYNLSTPLYFILAGDYTTESCLTVGYHVSTKGYCCDGVPGDTTWYENFDYGNIDSITYDNINDRTYVYFTSNSFYVVCMGAGLQFKGYYEVNILDENGLLINYPVFINDSLEIYDGTIFHDGIYANLLPEDTGTHFVKWDNVTKQLKSDNSIFDSLYNGWTISDDGDLELIRKDDTVTFIGKKFSNITVDYDPETNITEFDSPFQDLSYTMSTGEMSITGGSSATIPVYTGNMRGLVPDPGGAVSLNKFLDQGGAWTIPDFAPNRPLPLPDLNDDLLVDASDLSEWTNHVARTDLVDEDIYALDFNMNGHVDMNDAAFIHSCYGMSINDPTDSAFIEAQRSFLRSQSFTSQFGDSIFNIVGQIFINQYWDKSTDDLTGYIPIFDTAARKVTLNEIGTATLENQLGMRLVHYTDFGLGGDDDQDLSYTAATRALDITGGTGVTLPLFDPASTNAGLVPGGDNKGETYYLDATGAWNQPVGLVTASSLGNNPIYAGRDGNDLEFYGIREGKWVDITKSGDTSWTIAADSSLIVNAVTNLLDDYQLKSDTNNYDATYYYVDSVTLFHTENGAVEMKDNTVLRIDDGDKLSFVNNVGDSAKIYMAGENFVIHPENGFETQLYSDLYVMGDTLYVDGMTRAKKANMVFWDDVSGVFTVEDTTGIGGSDNLGNHTATDDLDMNNFDITKVADLDVGGTALVVDGTNDLVAINQASGTATLDVFTSEDEYILNLTKSKTTNGSTGAGPGITFSRALDAMGAISSGAVTGIIRTRGYDGSAFRNVTNIQGAAQTVSGSTMSGQLKFLTNNTSGNMTERMEINEDGTVGINNTTAESILDVGGSFAIPVTLISTNTTLDGTHHTILVDNNDAGTGRITITLPQASTCDGREYLIKLYDEGVGGNGFTIDAYSTERIYLTQGASAETYNFDSEGGSVTIQSYNGGWVVTNWCLAPAGW